MLQMMDRRQERKVHYLDEFHPLLRRWPTIWVEENGYTRHWWRAQCDFRGIASYGTEQEVRVRLRLSTNDDQEACLHAFYEVATDHAWHEEAFRSRLQRVIPESGAPLTIKVRPGNRLAVLRACNAMGLASQSVQPLASYRDQSRWVVIGTSPLAVRVKAQEVAARFQIDEEEDRLRARSDLLSMNAIEPAGLGEGEYAHSRGTSEENHQHEESDPEENHEAGGDFADVLARLPRASLDELQSIKGRYLMHDGQILDPDVDMWIPDDPKSKDLGLIASGNSDRLKAYWIAQCHFRGLLVETKDSIVSLQGKLRDRDGAVETRIEALKDLCEQVLDAEWHLENPLLRFNIRAVRKGRAIMLQPERNSIARGQWTARNIRDEVRDAHFGWGPQRYA